METCKRGTEGLGKMIYSGEANSWEQADDGLNVEVRERSGLLKGNSDVAVFHQRQRALSAGSSGAARCGWWKGATFFRLYG